MKWSDWRRRSSAIIGGCVAIVDTTETFDAGVRSLEAHRVYLEHLGGDMASPDAFLRGAAESTGPRIGVELAAAFELVG